MTVAHFQGCGTGGPAVGGGPQGGLGCVDGLCRAVPGFDLTDLHTQTTQRALGLITYSSFPHSYLHKNPVDKHIHSASVIFKDPPSFKNKNHAT